MIFFNQRDRTFIDHPCQFSHRFWDDVPSYQYALRAIALLLSHSCTVSLGLSAFLVLGAPRCCLEGRTVILLGYAFNRSNRFRVGGGG
ncbi:hypothetical protein [Coleofasciculus sp. G2-EDA-02]|uniref:hypothetical protein n=1 Tax=Coleofasciculus sp. G2-EDA-02 TaxID=3069529 RepID=UPI0032F8E68B